MSKDRGQLTISHPTRTAQANAADPNSSIWVEANAGSGKTFVLTRRVMRLLLADVRPESILCLTYTKAAAAEMRRRVAHELAQWAVMDDAALFEQIEKLEGKGFDPKLTGRARTLFARALETPGGLKIVTIHAFCESVLHRFPLEAGVPFDFAVIEDDQRTQMVLAAREAVMADGVRGIGNVAAVETLFDRLSDHQIAEAIDTTLSDSRKLRTILLDRDEAKGRLRAHLSLGQETVGQLNERLISESYLTPRVCRHLVQLLGGDGSKLKPSRFADILACADPDALTAADLRSAFFTGTGPRASLMSAKLAASHPDIADALGAEQERIGRLLEAIGAAELVERSEALLDIVAAISEQYEAAKRAHSLLDFDDLIEKLGDLFADPALGPWVQYKLDAGIDHILVDESQDTNPEQWRVVKAIADEFFTGAGAVTRPRSLFAVGDQKQSIYSFQGAEPKLFGETGAYFAQRAKAAAKDFSKQPLQTSFRTLRGIIEAVDLVALLPEIKQGLLATDVVHHDTARQMPGGTVTLWPPLQQAGGALPSGEWPVDPPGGELTAARQVATTIAAKIKHWIASARPLAGRGRAVRADDVLILVQTRGTVFQEIIRALRLANLPTPGTDRLAVTGHIAVMDLLALCDVLLNPADDLQLAALLRSPLFDISEHGLLQFAGRRARGETLWSALLAATEPAAIAAATQLRHWRGQLDFERPFEFLTEVLYADGGLKRFHARLGSEVDEVFAELLELALAHEQAPQPSLQGFIAEMRRRDVSIKRELSETGTGVRVMTVHGAKGLEAPIVILADAASKPKGRQTSRPVYVLTEPPGPLLLHAAGKAQHVARTTELRDRIEANRGLEYWRLLYVAMTRAEDELYITGALTPGAERDRQLEGTWYAAVDIALRSHAERQVDDDGLEIALIYPSERPLPVPVGDSTLVSPAELDALLLAPLPAYAARPIITPSSAGAEAARIGVLDTSVERLADAEASRREGIALHALLQHLGKLDRSLWPQVAPKAMAALLPDTPERHVATADKAIAILSAPELRQLFGSDSRAELPFLIGATRDGESLRIAGRIDRLVVGADTVLVVDYKSDATPPDSAAGVPPAYLMQLGLYALVAGQLFPGHTVTAGILWTTLEQLMILPPAQLAAATQRFTVQ